MLTMIFTFLKRFAVALVLLIVTSLSYVHADFQTTFSHVVTLMGTDYKADTLATKKGFSKIVKALKKEHKNFKSFSLFSRSSVDFNLAVTKLCASQQWPVSPKSYTNCRAFAEQNGFLASPLVSKPTSPRAVKLTNLQLATLIARSVDFATTNAGKISSDVHSASNDVSSTLPSRKMPTNAVSSASDGKIDVHFFSTVQLDEPLPKKFYVGEVYLLSGTVRSGKTDSVFAFTCPITSGCGSTRNFARDTKGDTFSIPIYFDTPGNFNLGIIPGHSGESRLADITVVSDEPSTYTRTSAPAASATMVKYSKGVTTFSWNANGFSNAASESTPHFSRLVVFQNSQRADFLFRQQLTSFSPESLYFKGFLPGSANWMIMQDGTRSTIQNISLVTQHFYKHEAGALSLENFSDYTSSPQGASIRFTGVAKTTIAKTLAVTLPNGTVKEYVQAEKDFAAGSRLSFTIPTPDAGTYIFEINDTLGSAALNAPVYVGNGIPLLPDFFELNEQKLSTAPVGTLSDVRANMLNLINRDRAANGLSMVTLDTALNNVAQNHTQSMVDQNFFGHVNPQGKSPDDRRRSANIQTPIRENLGKSTSLEHVEQGLMRSPIHRDALLDPRMKKVGIGVVKTADGYFLVTQNFSGDQLNQSTLSDVKRALLDQAQATRGSKGLSLFREDPNGTSAANLWSTAMASNKFFSLSAPAGCSNCPGDTITQTVRSQGIHEAFEVYIVKTSNQSVLVDELVGQNGMVDSTNNRISIGLSVGDFGEIYMVVLYF